jgi:hypothetical protein
MGLKRGNTDEVAVIVDTKLQAQVTQEMFMDGYKIAVDAMKGKSGLSYDHKIISCLMLINSRRATGST